MPTTTTTPRTRRADRGERAAIRAALDARAARRRDMGETYEAGRALAVIAGEIGRHARTLSDDERDALASVILERVAKRHGAHDGATWHIPRTCLAPKWLRWQVADALRRESVRNVIADVADPAAPNLDAGDLDGYGREREDAAPGCDAVTLARRLADALAEIGAVAPSAREGTSRAMLAMMLAERGPDGAPIYGPRVAALAGCNLATLRKSVQRFRERVPARVSPADLADMIAETAARLTAQGPADETADALMAALAPALRDLADVLKVAARKGDRRVRRTAPVQRGGEYTPRPERRHGPARDVLRHLADLERTARTAERENVRERWTLRAGRTAPARDVLAALKLAERVALGC